MPDLPSWKDLQKEFLQYATEHAGLVAIWAWKHTRDGHSLLGPPEGYWDLKGGSPGSQHLFREIARRAVGRLSNPSGPDPWRSWLDQLRAEGYARKIVARKGSPWEFRAAAKASGQPPLPPGCESEHIENVFKSSAEFCQVRSLAGSHVEANEVPVVQEASGMRQTATFNRCPVTVVREEGTPLETRWDTLMGGDFTTHAIFDDGPQRVRSGDWVHCSLFSEPHVVSRIEPELVGLSVSGSNVAYWKAKIMPRSEWLRHDGDNQLRSFGEFNPLVLGASLPRPEYPKHMYHKTDGPVVAHDANEEASARARGYGDHYIHKEFPKWKYHWTKDPVIVNSPEEETALGGGWANTPTAFSPFKDPTRIKSEQHDPIKWVDEWTVPSLAPDHCTRIKARLLKAHSAYWKSPDAPAADFECMRLAFDGVAEVLFDAGILTQQVLENDLPVLVWDSAIASGWFRFASETPKDICPEPVGHYWIWRDESRDWSGLFKAETADWLARLMEASVFEKELGQVDNAGINPGTMRKASETQDDPLARRRRTPDLQSSRERLELVKVLASELATIKHDLKRYCTAETLKNQHPNFALWQHLTEAELKELVDGDSFAPKAYAENLTLRHFGLTSRETLKKDRKKLREAKKAPSA